ncbi:MAG: hypothetical protein IJ649_00505 [Oscillospiraceae bacterium]|nr:hypothetical protein [Oscillospiraceae bacterium]
MYIIQEIQTTGNTTALLPAIQKTDSKEMESTYHQIMATAAISAVTVHTCLVYDEHGNDCTPGKKYYEHIAEGA